MAHFFAGRKRKSFWSLLGPIIAAAGAALLLYLLLAPSDKGIPDWQPVNGALRATLALGESPSSTSPPPASAAKPEETAGPKAESKVESAAPRPSEQAPTPSSSPGQTTALLDLNAAAESELDGLPGIGPSKAKAIIAYRDAHRGFRAVDELLQVKGIGAKLFERIRPLVTVAQAKSSPG